MRSPSSTHAIAVVGGLAVIFSAAVAATDTGAPRIAYDEALKTRALHPLFRNPLYTAPPATGATSGASAFFSGGVWGVVPDPALKPLPVTPPLSTAPKDSSHYLVWCAFGQAFSSDIPYATVPGCAAAADCSFARDAVSRAGKLLYFSQADNILPADDSPEQGKFARDKAALRYRDLMYAVVDGTPTNQLEVHVLPPAGQIEARLKTMGDFYGAAERSRSVTAERVLRDALKHAPIDAGLRTALLDLYYDRAVAEQALAKEKLVKVARLRLEPPPPGGFVISNEIGLYEGVLGDLSTPGGYRYAMKGYFELLSDPMGIDASALPGARPGQPYGSLLFTTLVPSRSLYAASYLNASGTPTPVIAGGAPLFAGWKDLTMLFDLLTAYSDATTQLARLYAMRGDGGDRDKALALIAEAHAKLYLEGKLLLGLFDPAALPGPSDASGLAASISGWRQGMGTLLTTRDFLRGDANLLGFDPSFLMLVQKYQGQSGDVFDSYDAIKQWIVKDATSPLTWARAKYDEARTSYDTYRGHQDQLATQYNDRQSTYDQRLFKIVGDDRGGPRYGTPESNVGCEIYQQKLSIDIAVNRIRKNDQEVTNLQKQVEYEVERRAKERGIEEGMSLVMVQYGDRQASLTEEISYISAAQAAANSTAQAASSVTAWGIAVNAVNGVLQAAGEVGKGLLQGEKERLAAQERAELNDMQSQILDVNSEAQIKTWLLQMSTLALDSIEAQLVLAQEVGRMAALYDEKADIERHMDQENALLAGRYFADPVHLLRMQTDMIEAEQTFQEAQKWVFYLARAWEYKWNTPFTHSHAGHIWSLGSLFRLRNAEELQAMVAALDSKNGLLEGSLVRDDYFDWFSVRGDFFGYAQTICSPPGAVPVAYCTYADPVTGQPITYRPADNSTNPPTPAVIPAIEAFHRKLRQLQDADGNIVLDLSTVRELPGGTFFRGPRFSGTTLISKGLYLDKIKWLKIALPGTHPAGRTQLTGTLTYAGTSVLRNMEMGVVTDPARPDLVSGETTAYPTRYWFFHAPSDAWRSSEGLSAPVQMQLTSDPRVPPTVTEIDVFKERSVATTDWKLVIPTTDLGTTVLDINNLNDIELYFYHNAVVRP
jgi:hypothetical protein